VTRQTVIAYWLIPSEPAHSFFQRTINDLACRYEAPVFEPHLTVHVGADQADAAAKALEKAASEFELVRQMPLGIDQSDDFVKTLFVQFAMTAQLGKINGVIRHAAKDSSQYELKPHLSLLYKNLPAAARRELAASITLPFSEIPFDSLQAIRCVSPTQKRADVEAWELIASKILR
jgi:2'-5' RNA ligase